jgi:glycine cleavage system H protein
VEFPKELKYTLDHEWVLLEDGTATIGITDHAQDALGDIVYLGDLPEVGDEVSATDVIGVVESVKATSDILCPLSGEVLEINDALDDTPEAVNESPYGDGWIIKIRYADEGELSELIDVDAYQALLEDEA